MGGTASFFAAPSITDRSFRKSQAEEKASAPIAPSIIGRRSQSALACSPFFLMGGSAQPYEITKALWAGNGQAMLLLERGKNKLALGEWKDALTKLNKAIESFKAGIENQPELAGELQKRIAECHGNYGYVLFMLRDRDGALAEFGAALKLDSTCFDAHLYLGHAELQGDPEHKLQGDPEAANLHYLMAFESLKNKILKYIEAADELELDLPHCLHCIGIALSKLGEHDPVKHKVAIVYYDEAIRLYEKEIEKHPEFANGLEQLLALCKESRSQLAP